MKMDTKLFFDKVRQLLRKNVKDKSPLPELLKLVRRNQKALPARLVRFVNLGITPGPSKEKAEYKVSEEGIKSKQQWLRCLHNGTCVECGRRMDHDKLMSLTKNRRFCSSPCANKNEGKKANTVSAVLEKYGVINTSQLPEVREKALATMKERYGFEYFLRDPEHRKKQEAKNMKRYGVKHHFAAKEIKDKIVATCLERYGVPATGMLQEVKEKRLKTLLERYGEDNAQKVEAIKLKTKKTNQKKYGGASPGCSEKVKLKAKATSRRKYGTDFPMQHPEVFNRQQATVYKRFNIKLKGKLFKGVQGYEPQALRYLVNELKIPVNRIITGSKDVGFFKYRYKDQEKVYFPDIRIKGKDGIDTILEIKSIYTFKVTKEITKAKLKAVKNQGNKVALIVMAENGSVLKHFGEAISL